MSQELEKRYDCPLTANSYIGECVTCYANDTTCPGALIGVSSLRRCRNKNIILTFRFYIVLVPDAIVDPRSKFLKQHTNGG